MTKRQRSVQELDEEEAGKILRSILLEVGSIFLYLSFFSPHTSVSQYDTWMCEHFVECKQGNRCLEIKRGTWCEWKQLQPSSVQVLNC